MKIKLKQAFNLQMGKTPARNRPDYWNGENKWISIADIGNTGKFLVKTKESITEAGIEGSGIKVVPQGTVIMSFKLSIGKTAITSEDMYTNEAIMAFIDNGKFAVDTDYLYHLCCGTNWTAGTNKAVMGLILNKATLLEKEIPLPDINEQHEIATKLDKIDAIIAERQQQLELIDQLVKSRFIELFGSISEEVPLSYYIAGLNAGKSLAGEEENHNKVLKTGAATYDYFDATQIKNLPIDYEPQESHRVKAGDVIISRMNTAELVGAAAYVWDVPEHIYLPDRLWRADVKETANPIFVWQVLIQSSTKESIRRIASGTSGSMKNISKLGLLGIRVVKAPINLQQQFAAFVEQTDKSKYYSSLSFRYCQAAENAYRQEWITCRTSDF